MVVIFLLEIAKVLSKVLVNLRETLFSHLFVMAETILEILIPFRTAALIDTLRLALIST